MKMPSKNNSTRFVAGTMTGTSIDGLDAALIEIRGSGLELEIKVRQCLSRSFGAFATDLRRLAEQDPMTASEITKLNHKFSEFHLECLRDLIKSNQIDLIALHGQTVFHSPPFSWQLINPTIIAQGLKVPVVYDLRAADLVHGGQGAPITPIADFILFRDMTESRSIVNLGGFCNITSIPSWRSISDNKADPEAWLSSIAGADICPCNHLLDKIARDLIGKPFDKDGESALTGSVFEIPFNDLMNILRGLSTQNRSLGTGDESGDWISLYSKDISAVDLARTACAAIAEMIVNYCSSDRIILAGGGVNNAALKEEIKVRFSGEVSTCAEYGIPTSHREAIEMAILGAECWDRIPITLPQITGSNSSFVSGCWVLP